MIFELKQLLEKIPQEMITILDCIIKYRTGKTLKMSLSKNHQFSLYAIFFFENDFVSSTPISAAAITTKKGVCPTRATAALSASLRTFFYS